MKSQLPRFRLGTLLICVTLLCFWLGYQMRWVHQRREALVWIENHRPDKSHSFVGRWFLGSQSELLAASWFEFEQGGAPWMVSLLREPKANTFIGLDRTKLKEPEEVVLDRIQGLFPEAEGVYFITPRMEPSTTLTP